MGVELLVADSNGIVYQPPVQENVEWTTARSGTPGKLTFKVIYDGVCQFTEGSPVRVIENGDKIFFGFVFKKERSKDNIFTVTAYDQLRYLKNKDTIVYTNKTANEFIKMLSNDYSLNIGELADTGYKIPSRVEENTTLFDMVQNSIDLTLQNTGELYVLYDDFGKLTLKSLDDMRVGNKESMEWLCIDEDTAQNYSYISSIDEQTYNKIKLTYDNDKTGKREVYIAQDSSHINEWGILQYFDTLKKGENGQSKADSLLDLYNSKTKKLQIKDAIGDNRVAQWL